MSKVIIGSNNESFIAAYENALLYYVYGRVTLNTDWFLFLLPSIFYFFHHSVEVSIKTLLTLGNIKYPDRGQNGHKTCVLLLLAANSGSFSKNISNLIKNQDLLDLLKAMDDSYLKNKYEYPGYNLRGVRFVELIDEIIFIFFEEINSVLKSKVPPHALATLNVPSSVEKMFLHKLKKPFSYTALGFRED